MLKRRLIVFTGLQSYFLKKCQKNASQHIMFSRRLFKIQNVQKMSKRRIIVFTWLQSLPSQHKMFSRRLLKIQNVQKISKRRINVFTGFMISMTQSFPVP